MMTTDSVLKRAEFGIKTRKGQYSVVCELRRSNRTRMTIDLEPVEETVELSICGSACEYGGFNSGGQCVDAIRKAAIEYDLHALDELCDVWNRWHLNGMKAGNRAQLEALEEFKPIEDTDVYAHKCKFLESRGLLISDGYTYGSAWLFEPLPDDVWDVVEAAKEECDDFEEEVELTQEELAEELAEALHGIDADQLIALSEHLGCDLGDAAKYHDENYQGHYASDAEFAEELADQLGYEVKNEWPHRYIDWEAAGRDLMHDYFEIDGHYYRNE